MANELLLEVNGIIYQGFTSGTVTKSLESFAGTFSFSISQKEAFNEAGEPIALNIPIKLQDEVKVFIDDEQVISGYVEDLKISYDAGSHNIQISGRDKAADLIDSSIIAKQYQLQSFKSLIELVLSENGYSDIEVTQEVGDINTLNEGERYEAENGDTIFSFIDRYAKKLQVMITTDQDGNILITRESTTKNSTSLLNTRDNQTKQNVNILKASLDVSSKDRYRFIQVFSQSNNNNFTQNTVDQNAEAEDEIIRSPRRLRVISKVASDRSYLEDLAKWQINLRRAKGQRYNCTVVGFHTEGETGDIWRYNTLVDVRDNKCDLDGEFLIQGVTYRKSNQGTFTDLSIVNKNSFTLDIETAEKEADINNFGNSFINKAN